VFGRLWALVAVAVGLAAALFFHLRNVHALLAWLRNPVASQVPLGTGVWEHVFSALYRHIRATSQYQHRLTGQLARFRSAAQAMPDGVVVLDAEDRITWCNATAERVFGLDVHKDAGQPILNLVRHPDFGAYIKGGRYEEPLVARMTGMDELMLSIRVVPYGQEEKLLLARDVTQAERLETMRRDFVANVSHELKTPLTVVSGFLETFAEGNVRPDEPRGRKALEMMRSQTDRMLRLIEDLLMLSALESSAVPAREQLFDVERLLAQILDEARVLSGGRHRIELRIARPAKVLGDERELASAFGNLVSNAIRYTPTDGSIVLAWDARDGEGVFSVADTGIGIAPHHLPRLTERFYRADTSRSRDTGGTGLGLAIVKHVLTRHQARLEIQSEPGRGSRFSAVLPARRVRFAPAAQLQPEVEKLIRS
jgi:two-component system phosphate regulon sensor histidine kinase PhoR